MPAAGAEILVMPVRTREPPALDVPERGLPMSARVELAAAPHRRLLSQIADRAARPSLEIAEKIVGPCSAQRASRLVAGIATIAAALAGLPVDADDAMTWFLGDGAHARPRLSGRWDTQPDEQLAALLPYVLDPFGLTSRRSLLAGQSCAKERGERKRVGTFYTPGDVARALTSQVISSDTRRVLDPACGAGVFLRAAFTLLCATSSSDDAVRRLHGIDVDPCAVDACAIVLTHDWLIRRPPAAGESPQTRFLCVRSRLVCADALELYAQSAQRELFSTQREPVKPRLPIAFDAVLMNPPFAAMGPMSQRTRLGYASLREAHNPAGVNRVWPFWEFAARVTAGDGRAGAVLPLSVAYLDDGVARATRNHVFACGSWEMRFFDRSPDALFGDDVKQRVALAVKRPGPAGLVRTTSVRRWSADQRAAALELTAGEGVEMAMREHGIAKIGSVQERDALTQLASAGAGLGQATRGARLSSARDLHLDERAIAVAPTAYNWIGVFRCTKVAEQARRGTGGKVAELTFASSVMADAAYAIVASRIFLWWWRATGDLFHVPLSMLKRAPFALSLCGWPELARLSRAGRACWEAASLVPTTAVNRGITTVAYAPPADCAALDEVDRSVGVAFGLSPEVVRFVREDTTRLRVAGRSS